MNTNKNNISWDVFHSDARTLANKIKSSGSKFSAILAISRGGLTLAHILAIELDIKKVMTVCLSSYTNKTRNRLRCLYKPDILSLYTLKNVLIVDDLADSGKSLSYVKKLTRRNNYKTAVLYKKKVCPITIDYYIEDNFTEWVIFPWET